jgi:hypothetical protein
MLDYNNKEFNILCLFFPCKVDGYTMVMVGCQSGIFFQLMNIVGYAKKQFWNIVMLCMCSQHYGENPSLFTSCHYNFLHA